MIRPGAEVATGSSAIATETVEGIPMSEIGVAPEDEEDADDLLDIPAFLRRQAN